VADDDKGRHPRVRGTLWRNPDFLKLWTGETVSFFGQRIAQIAIPLTAADTLQAGASQMGLLVSLQYVPYLLVILFAGVWVDRCRRRPVLVAANLGRAVLLALIPLFALLDMLAMRQLYVICFLVGVCSTFFDLAYQAYLPALVKRNELIEGNSKLQLSASVAEISGPGVGGVLVQLVTAPIAIIANALSYMVSVLALLSIRRREPAPPPAGRVALWREIGGGFRIAIGNPYLRACVGEAATYNLMFYIWYAVFVLYCRRDLEISPGVLGLIMSCASVGALAGSLWAGRLADRFGFGRTILGAMLVSCVAFLLVPLAAGTGLAARVLPAAAYLIGGFAVAVSNIHVVSLRQTVTPDRLLGRMNASYRFFIYGTISLGSLAGGYLGEALGLRATLLVGTAGLLVAWLWVLFSPLPGVKRLSDLEEDAALLEGVGTGTASSAGG